MNDPIVFLNLKSEPARQSSKCEHPGFKDDPEPSSLRDKFPEHHSGSKDDEETSNILVGVCSKCEREIFQCPLDACGQRFLACHPTRPCTFKAALGKIRVHARNKHQEHTGVSHSTGTNERPEAPDPAQKRHKGVSRSTGTNERPDGPDFAIVYTVCMLIMEHILDTHFPEQGFQTRTAYLRSKGPKAEVPLATLLGLASLTENGKSSELTKAVEEKYGESEHKDIQGFRILREVVRRKLSEGESGTVADHILQAEQLEDIHTDNLSEGFRKMNLLLLGLLKAESISAVVFKSTSSNNSDTSHIVALKAESNSLVLYLIALLLDRDARSREKLHFCNFHVILYSERHLFLFNSGQFDTANKHLAVLRDAFQGCCLAKDINERPRPFWGGPLRLVQPQPETTAVSCQSEVLVGLESDAHDRQLSESLQEIRKTIDTVKAGRVPTELGCDQCQRKIDYQLDTEQDIWTYKGGSLSARPC